MLRSPKKFIAVVLLIAALGVVYMGATHRWFFGRGATAAVTSASAGGERKVLYWYDSMNPQHHYNQPGKAPDGMDLVPLYAEQTAKPAEQTSSSSPSNMANMPGMSTKSGERKVLYWYDPMHPAYKSDKPGIAPDCGMTLVPKYAEDESMAKMPMGTVTITPEKQVMAGVRTAIVERKPLVRDIRTTTQIVADETKIAHVHVKVAGYIDQVYVDFVGQLVKKGQPLFTLYSPDLVSTEEEYLIAKRGNATLGNAPFEEVSQGAQSLLKSTRQRLKLWDISDDQIKQLDQTGKVSKDLTFYSPITGFVTDRKVFPQTSVTPDTELYTVSDLSTVWADADIYEYEVPFVHLGQRVTLTLSYYPGKTYTGNIAYVYPTVDPQTRTVKVRIQLPNPGFDLKPQMFADAELRVDYGVKIVVPDEAVLDAGTEQRVFVVHPGGIFEPRKVILGPVFDGNAAVLSGLKAGETVVVSGNFLIDSESNLKDAMSGMTH
ncbi:MAG TPA: efflux RND transporter periplasmic adaptor subunit [Edaphobacter sp.]|uniref:efflux RND transporter periplasmic adaptor subunit n=1 Tax=Edaphobacter sp. TaxID=1934404 RepID=UPI002BF03E5E|nr:efflux RND transporter periplasmic adaptor subunit [Edaphobacter sp.]HUZ97084.1 efflux RND transporter periplasmic adaptor subunit [Edaphobacter sp.]